ncbi:triphosphoribosyl-dephospho-CoA synthase [Desulfurococcus mucosus]|uniref:Triphosphoribosyl-dephospho-CoA protein n=1 Tax=Desulfurococcus mucosus (strain ATCC 35584 / DSM 2162 / JCM 9187 / O7/1) TaxID=765177 RepID=E8R9T2_DESM0|nr:triphosphoribosyl-dephospho-CoA synthase [Desulfurococcus mucosus]ADV65258.1 triphosphoribosyl-dephospho-CoA protein [Desulfurococcus mucosus DSM 2162]
MNIDVFPSVFSLSLILEASAWPKPGNVHRLRERRDLRYEAFLATGVLAYRYFKKGVLRGVRGWRRIIIGDLIYMTVSKAIDDIPSTNTCLGSSTLLMPLSVGTGRCIAKEDLGLNCITGEASRLLRETSVEDAVYYYRAVRKASPSYLKPSDNTGSHVNIWDPDYAEKLAARGIRLIDVLEYSSRIDIVADEVVNGYKRSLALEGFLRKRVSSHGEWNRGVVEAYLHLLAEAMDTVVVLKHGVEVAEYVRRRATEILPEVLAAGSGDWVKPVMRLDDEFYEHGINPGAIADVTAAGIALFLLRNTIDGKRLLEP